MSSPDNVLDLSHKNLQNVPQEVSQDEDTAEINQSGVPDEAGGVAEVPGVQSGAQGERATEASGEAVRAEQSVSEAAQEQLEPIPNAPKFLATARQFYGHTKAQHGVHLVVEKSAPYTCEDCADLERRIRKAFKDMGYEF